MPLKISHCAQNMNTRHLHYWITAKVVATAVSAKVSSPYGVKLFDKRFNKCRVVGKNAVFKVALLHAFRAHPRTRQVGRAEIRLAPVNDDTLEMHSRTKHSFHSTPQIRITVEIIPPVRPRLLRMNEPHLNASLQHPVQHLQERHYVPPASINVHILDIRSGNPQPLPRLRHNPSDDGGIDVSV